jgi:hypothetical protein
MKKIITGRLLLGTFASFLAMSIGGLPANAQSFAPTVSLNAERYMLTFGTTN